MRRRVLPQTRRCINVFCPRRRVARLALVTYITTGGSLCASVVLAIPRNQLPTPAGAWLISPMSSSTPLASTTTNAKTDDFAGWDDAALFVKLHQLIANTGSATEIPITHPDVAPAFGDYTGVCPLFISAVATEALRDDAIAIAKAARRAGVSVKVSIARHGLHTMPIFGARVVEGAEETALAARWLAERLHPGFGDYE